MAGEITAIPTRYKGIQFRSRLEAKWATFFDAFNLTWEYEPEVALSPCSSGGWIPDFIITGLDWAQPSKTPLLVEVKGIGSLSEWATHECIKKIHDQIDFTSWTCLLLGPAPTSQCVGRAIHSDRGIVTLDDVLLVRAAPCAYDFLGKQEGQTELYRHNLSDLDVARPDMVERIERAWTDAHNTTQWRAPRVMEQRASNAR